jgi:hypothetical protein
MKDAQKPDHISLNTLIGHLKEGRFVIPDFQREFEWRPWDINYLMRSIFLDYYIGSLLLWKGKKENFNALSCEIIYGFDNETGNQPWNYGKGNPEFIVLDGQQRLTALYYAFIAPNVPLPDRSNRAAYFIKVDKFMAEEYDVAFQYNWIYGEGANPLDSRERQYAEHVFPLSILGAGRYDLPNWLQGYRAHWEEEALRAKNLGDATAELAARAYTQIAEKFGEHVMGIAEQYQIAHIELDKDLPVDKVCDIFTQINSRGIRLDVFDLINALLKPKGLQLKLMWREAAPRLGFVETGKMNVYILQVMSILCQSYCSSKYLYYLLPGQEKLIRLSDGKFDKEILIPSTEDFKRRWEEAVAALESAISLLKHPQEFGAISAQYLPYVSILPAFAALQTTCNCLAANRRLNAQLKIRQWYWASVFINRYSGSVESTSARDYQDVKAWMEDDEKKPDMIEEFRLRLPLLDLSKEVKKGSSIYNGIFNLLVRQGARDWMTGTVPQYGNLDDHHIVPASWGYKHLKNDAINTILNRTPLNEETNRNVINDRLPNTYLPELIANNGKAQVQAIMESHFISPVALDILLRNPFAPEDYAAFIRERQRTILDEVESLLIKERLGLPVPLRELDQAIEKAELALRSLIASALNNDPDQLPPHIAQRISESIERAKKKTAYFDIDKYRNLTAKLEYADLRELQEIITSKATWPMFEARFLNKETLNTKFGQLAELRNSIRHSRSVDEVTRMEGGAAVVWFHGVLRIDGREGPGHVTSKSV